MNPRTFVFTLMTIICIQAVATAQPVRGNGKLVTQDRESAPFKEIQSFGSFNIVITDANNHKISVEADENLQSLIETTVENGQLKIRHKRGVNIKTSHPVTVHVSTASLRAISLFGSGNVSATNTLDGSDELRISSSGSGNIKLDIQTEKVLADLSGSGNITLKGSTKELEGRIQGSGNIRARELQSQLTSIKIGGSGNAEVVATQKLNSKIAGSGDVKYWGDAAVDSKVAGSGRVSRQK